MAKIKVPLARRNPSKRERLVTGFVITTAMVILWVKGTSGISCDFIKGINNKGRRDPNPELDSH